MSGTSALIVLLKRCILSCLGLIRRAICCRRIWRRSDADPILPVTVKPGPGVPSISQTVLPGSYSQFSQYSSQSHVQTVTQSWNMGQQAGASNSLTAVQQSTELATRADEEETQEEADWFRDMEPKLRHQKKVLLHHKSSHDSQSQASSHTSNKFSVDASAAIVVSRELGDLDEEETGTGTTAWNEEELDMEKTIREAREADRRRRQKENEDRSRAVRMHQQQQHKSSRINKSLAASKLS